MPFCEVWSSWDFDGMRGSLCQCTSLCVPATTICGHSAAVRHTGNVSPVPQAGPCSTVVRPTTAWARSPAVPHSIADPWWRSFSPLGGPCAHQPPSNGLRCSSKIMENDGNDGKMMENDGMLVKPMENAGKMMVKIVENNGK